MFKKDSYILGALMAIVSPAVTFGFLYLLLLLLETVLSKGAILNEKNLILLSLIPNLIILRIYFVKYKFDKTGKGVLLITFILFILFFVFFHEW